MKSSIYVRSSLETSSIPVTPIIYLSNGTKLTLPPVILEPAGTAVIAINDALAAQGIAPYSTLSGYVELQYSWPWDALCATVTSVDATHSVIFTFGLTSFGTTPPSTAAQPATGDATSTQALEGAWWKQEASVTGFVALSNTAEQSLPATVQVSDANANLLGTYSVTISAHGTKRIDLQEFATLTTSVGGLHVTFSGASGAIIVNGGLENLAKGYSASIPFGVSPAASAQPATTSYAEVGLMTGAADPMMHFPAATTFTPYSVVRNLANQPVTVTPALYWMSGGAALSARLPSFTMAPLHTKNLDVLSLLTLAGLKNFNGSLNLVLEVQGVRGSMLLASGSVDQTETYVFEVVPRGVAESASKNLSYWSTANGDDTMVTLWNAADEAQDFVFALVYSGGHYLHPVHLEPRASSMFNVSELIQSQIPDSEGNVIPPAVHEGSAKLSGALGESQHILVSMDAGTYNVRKATCAWMCSNCNGGVSWALAANPFATAVGGSTQLVLTVTWNTGHQYNRNSASTWSSTNTAVATVSTGLVQGVAAGSVTVNGVEFSEPLAGQVCGSPVPPCPPDYGGGDSAPGTIQVPTFFDPQGFTSVSNACGGSFPYGVGTIVHYRLTDQNHTAINVAGITPRENVTSGGVQSGFKAFATPSTTNSDGSFDDKSLAICSATPPPPNTCSSSSQAFDVLVPKTGGGTTESPIKTTTSLRLCLQGDSVTVNANDGKTAPVNFTFGTVN